MQRVTCKTGRAFLASPLNAQRLDESIAALAKREGTFHDLLEE
jgi:hypothetical protein